MVPLVAALITTPQPFADTSTCSWTWHFGGLPLLQWRLAKELLKSQRLTASCKLDLVALLLLRQIPLEELEEALSSAQDRKTDPSHRCTELLWGLRQHLSSSKMGGRGRLRLVCSLILVSSPPPSSPDSPHGIAGTRSISLPGPRLWVSFRFRLFPVLTAGLARHHELRVDGITGIDWYRSLELHSSNPSNSLTPPSYRLISTLRLFLTLATASS